MGLFNDFLYNIGARCHSDWQTHRDHDRGDITDETLKESLRDNERMRERASRLTVEDYKRRER